MRLAEEWAAEWLAVFPMTPKPDPAQIREGDKVKVRVVQQLSSGVMVRLENGQRGIIRRRELSWKRSLGDDEQAVAVGDELEVVVLRAGLPGSLWELSLKRAWGDPWEKVRAGKYRSGDVVSGEVVNLEPYGAFVELEPGIDGLLPKGAIPGGRDREIQDLLWIGDQVEAVITHIDDEKRHIDLSIIERLTKRRNVEAERAAGVAAVASAGQRASGIPQLGAPDWASIQGVGPILVVDDDREFADGFAEWLRRLGCQVSTACEGTTAITADSTYDLVFLDLELGDQDGLEVARQIAHRDWRTHIVLMTGLGWFERGLEGEEKLEISAVLLKPLDDDEVLRVLRAAARGELTRTTLQRWLAPEESVGLVENLSTVYQEPSEARQKLERVLDGLRGECVAKAVLLFEIDPPTQRVSIAASSGLDMGDVEQSQLQPLRFSPVRDVALDGERIQEPDAPNQGGFDRLLQLFFFDSCVAVPIPTVGPDARYALFLFDPDTGRPLSEHMACAISASYFIATVLHEERVRALIRAAQRPILVGQLASALLHELGNHLGRIGQYAQNLKLDCAELAESPRTTPLIVFSGRMQRRVEGILDTNAALKGIVADQLGLMGREAATVVDVNALLEKTARQVAPLARENRVRVLSRLDARLPRTIAIPLELEQVFLNLALNAVQQMGAQVPRGEVLEISSLYQPRDAALPIKVRFRDEGPGVHRSLWDWIFEMGTSTREGGTGLGLFISRNLIERMGGRLSVEQSQMFVGSTFLVELPVVVTKEAADA